MGMEEIEQGVLKIDVTKGDVFVRDACVMDGKPLAEMEEQMFADCWSEKSISETIQNPFTYCFVAEKKGEIVGYLLAYILADEVEIARIAVTMEYRRQGIGEQLLRVLRNNCLGKGYTKLLLEVRESDLIAQAFYQNKGFVVDGVRSSYYHSPMEDAVLMSCQIN